VKLLVEHKADVNEPGGNGKTPLILAAQNGHEDIISYLLERGAEVNGRNAADGTTALMWAANTGRARIVELLLESGGDARLIAKDGWSAGEAARMAGHDDIAAKLDRKI
jgi:ankyrin repeat protein